MGVQTPIQKVFGRLGNVGVNTPVPFGASDSYLPGFSKNIGNPVGWGFRLSPDGLG